MVLVARISVEELRVGGGPLLAAPRRQHAEGGDGRQLLRLVDDVGEDALELLRLEGTVIVVEVEPEVVVAADDGHVTRGVVGHEAITTEGRHTRGAEEAGELVHAQGRVALSVGRKEAFAELSRGQRREEGERGLGKGRSCTCSTNQMVAARRLAARRTWPLRAGVGSSWRTKLGEQSGEGRGREEEGRGRGEEGGGQG